MSVRYKRRHVVVGRKIESNGIAYKLNWLRANPLTAVRIGKL